MADAFLKRVYQIDRAQIARLRFLVESYEGLLFLRSLDGRAGLVELSYPPDRQADAEALLAALAGELGLRPAPPGQ